MVIKKYIRLLRLKRKYRTYNTDISSFNIDFSSNIGRNCLIGRNVEIRKNVTVGDFTYFNSDNYWTIIESNTVIGKFCSIAPGVIIGLGNHNYHNVSTHPFLYNDYYLKKITKDDFELLQTGLPDEEEKTVIGNDVWIGMNACIKRGVKIGDGAVIGMNAVVTKDVPPFAIVAGVPAKVISYRFRDEDIKFILDNPWWNFDNTELLEKYKYMYDIEDYKQNLR